MANIEVKQAFVNRVNYVPAENGSKARLGLTLNEGYKPKNAEKWNYITYEITLWDDQAEKFKGIRAGSKDKSQKSDKVTFKGYITELVGNTYEGKVYTKIRANVQEFGVVDGEAQPKNDDF
jgi:L-lactate utilization protein LutC